MSKVRIFISSAYRELEPFRGMLARTLTRLGYEPVGHERAVFGLERGDIHETLRRTIDSCDGFVHIVGPAYGAEPATSGPDAGKVSYSQFEFMYAQQQMKKTWIIAAGAGSKQKKRRVKSPRGGPAPPGPGGGQQAGSSLEDAYWKCLNDLVHIRLTGDTDESLALEIEQLFVLGLPLGTLVSPLGIQSQRLASIKAPIEAGTYETPEKLENALNRMLEGLKLPEDAMSAEAPVTSIPASSDSQSSAPTADAPRESAPGDAPPNDGPPSDGPPSDGPPPDDPPPDDPPPGEPGDGDASRIVRLLKHHRKIRSPSSLVRGDGDPVDCSVFAPPGIALGASIMIQVFAHSPDQAEDAAEMARERDDEAACRAIVSLQLEVQNGERLWFELSLPGLEVDTPEQNLTWRRRIQAVQFVATAPTGNCPRIIFGSVRVSLGENRVPVGHLKFKITLVHELCTKNRPESAAEVACRYRKAFISYASADRVEVLKRVQMLERLRLDYFQDVLTLEPGQRWEKELYRHIDDCDLFLLFWSRSARDSEWVLKEARYALNRKGDDEDKPPELIPVIIEGPPAIEPPDDLKHLHFNDRFVYFLKD